MSLQKQLSEYVNACFTGIWVQTQEQPEALAEIHELCAQQKWALATWDVDRGLRGSEGEVASNATDPVAAVKAINALADAEGSALLVLHNFHRFIESTEVMQALAHQVQSGKVNRTFIVILSPVVRIPVELEKQFVVLEHELPDREQLERIARAIATEPGELPAAERMPSLIDAAAGLTRYEAEGAFSLSLIRHGRLEPDAVWELKSGQLKKSGLLELHRGGERFDDLGGLDALKSFCSRALAAGTGGRRGAARPKGVLLLGVPGTGKSAFAKALGNEVGRPTLLMDVGALLGSLVGQSEENVRRALRIADAMSPCILFVDEIEKALSGVASSGQTDSGVTARVFGTLLTWLSDHASDVFFIGTCNDISKLPTEFSRAERFDGVFFLDVPAEREREKIWPIHLKRYAVNLDATGRPSDRDWTGAEIQSCCRLSALLDIPLVEAARNVVPVAVTACDSVQRLRAWANGRCLDANRPGIFNLSRAEPSPVPAAGAGGGRRVSRGAVAAV